MKGATGQIGPFSWHVVVWTESRIGDSDMSAGSLGYGYLDETKGDLEAFWMI